MNFKWCRKFVLGEINSSPLPNIPKDNYWCADWNASFRWVLSDRTKYVISEATHNRLTDRETLIILWSRISQLFVSMLFDFCIAKIFQDLCLEMSIQSIYKKIVYGNNRHLVISFCNGIQLIAVTRKKLQKPARKCPMALSVEFPTSLES